MFGTALFGVFVNLVMMKILHHHDHDHKKQENEEPVNEEEKNVQTQKNKIPRNQNQNENFKAALIHVLGDTFQSLMVLVASILIWLSPDKLKIVDPICTLIFPTVVYMTTKPVIIDCYLTLMEATPPKLDVVKFKKNLLEVNGVVNLHDLHTWRINSSNVMACYHVIIKGDKSEIMTKLEHVAHDYDISHTTVQVEDEEESEPLAYDCKHDH
jgi:zinc transporter 2